MKPKTGTPPAGVNKKKPPAPRRKISQLKLNEMSVIFNKAPIDKRKNKMMSPALIEDNIEIATII
jgi:hypothetical protein